MSSGGSHPPPPNFISGTNSSTTTSVACPAGAVEAVPSTSKECLVPSPSSNSTGGPSGASTSSISDGGNVQSSSSSSADRKGGGGKRKSDSENSVRKDSNNCPPSKIASTADGLLALFLSAPQPTSGSWAFPNTSTEMQFWKEFHDRRAAAQAKQPRPTPVAAQPPLQQQRSYNFRPRPKLTTSESLLKLRTHRKKMTAKAAAQKQSCPTNNNGNSASQMIPPVVAPSPPLPVPFPFTLTLVGAGKQLSSGFPGPPMAVHVNSPKPRVSLKMPNPPKLPTIKDSLITPMESFSDASASAPPPKTEEGNPSLPPNWEKNLDDTIMSLQTYKTFPVCPASSQFQVITELLSPFQVVSAEQIVNPDVWQRYNTARKEMLRSKSDDLELLSNLGFDEKEVNRRAHLNKHFVKDPLLLTEAGKYSPNEALLFHCTRNQQNLEKIMSQGLDERLSSFKGGLLGKGIYFADDPMKSILYDGTGGTILIFSVLLGDCLAVHNPHEVRTFVREPEKENLQKRNFTDQFFDSITAKPNGCNEFVIYNRQQCCPLYIIKYSGQQPGRIPEDITRKLNSARRKLPTVAWNPMPNQSRDGKWPFFAEPLFKKMHLPPRVEPSSQPAPAAPLLMPFGQQMQIFSTALNFGQPQQPPLNSNVTFQLKAPLFTNWRPTVANINNNNGPIIASSSASAPTPPKVPAPTAEEIKEKVATLYSILGKEKCDLSEVNVRKVLEKCRYRMDAAANFFLDFYNQTTKKQKGQMSSGGSTPSTTAAAPPQAIVKIDLSTKPNQNTAKAIPSPPGIQLQPQPSTSTSKARSSDMDMDAIASRTTGLSLNNTATPPTQEPTKEDCLICCDEYEAFALSPQLWKELKCSHKLCLSCHSKIETRGTTLSGIQHTSIKCPFCQEITGTMVGDCPTGRMTVTLVATSCEGYPGYPSYQIEYYLSHNGKQYMRTAYLPSTAEGLEVLNLLKTAWDLKLIFTIGQSNTTGAKNVPVWNVHHKTKVSGGVQVHGYPDPGYVGRVKEELKAFGIE